jgi:hypothetical protein
MYSQHRYNCGLRENTLLGIADTNALYIAQISKAFLLINATRINPLASNRHSSRNQTCDEISHPFFHTIIPVAECIGLRRHVISSGHFVDE